MPKRQTKKQPKKKAVSKKNGGPKNGLSISKLKQLEERLAFLCEKVRKPKEGEKRIRFYHDSDGDISCFLFYGYDKVFYWGKVKGKVFTFDEEVPPKFRPKRQKEIDISEIL